MITKIKKIILPIFIVLLFCEYNYAQGFNWKEYLDSNNSTWIDWTNYQIYSESNVKYNEFIDRDILIKNERIKLLNKIFDTLLNFRLDEKHKVKDLLNKESLMQIWDELNNNDVLSLIKLDKDIYKIVIKCKMTSFILQNMISQKYLLSQPVSNEPGQSSIDFLKSYSGVLIEVTTDKFHPFFYVYIYSADERLLFSPLQLKYDKFIKDGVALYLIEKNRELIKKRAGENPLILEANSIYNGSTNSLKVSEDSSFYLNFKSVIDLMKDGKLVIVKKNYSTLQKESINEFKVSE